MRVCVLFCSSDSVTYVVIVAVAEPHDDLRRDSQRLVSVQSAFADDVVEQLSSLRLLEHQVDAAVRLQHVVQLQNVRVLDQLGGRRMKR